MVDAGQKMRCAQLAVGAFVVEPQSQLKWLRSVVADTQISIVEHHRGAAGKWQNPATGWKRIKTVMVSTRSLAMTQVLDIGHCRIYIAITIRFRDGAGSLRPATAMSLNRKIDVETAVVRSNGFR
jgi:hypothetical protein